MSISIKEIVDILGIEKDNIKNYYKEIKDAKKLIALGYDKNCIWLKSDYGIYTKDKIILTLNNLIVVE